MSSKGCADLWRTAVTELVENLDAEQPEEAAAAPRTLADWSKLYIKYLQTLRKLGEVYDLAAHPQKRRTLAQMLHACIGRVLEIHAWLVKLNNDVDVLTLEAYLPELGLAPDALEVPVPACFREDRAEELAARDAAVAALRAAGPVDPEIPPGLSDAEFSESEKEGEAGAAEDEEAQKQGYAQAEGAPPATPEVHVLGGDEVPNETSSLMPDAAAVKIQAAARGWLARRQVEVLWREEMLFLGMLPPENSKSGELEERLEAIHLDRKSRQVQRQAEYDEALVVLKAKLKRQEEFGMREQMQEKLNDWFLKSWNPETGAYPELPEVGKGGSKAILHPAPPELLPEEATALAALKEKEAKAKAGKKKGKGPALDAPKMSKAFLEDLHEAIEEYIDLWQDYQEPQVAAGVQELADLPQPCGGSAADAFDAAMVRDELRPVVEEEVRLEVDADMRRMIANIKDMLKAAKDGKKKKGKKSAKGKKDGKKGGDKKKDGKKDPKKDAKGKKGAGAEGEGAKKPKKKRKDLTAGRSVESIFAELASNGLVRSCPQATLADYLGGPDLSQGPPPEAKKSKKGGKKGGAAAKPAASPSKSAKGGAKGAAEAAEAPSYPPYPPASMAHVRRTLAASCVLPLGAFQQLGSKIQPPRAVLVYGQPGSGKSLLADAIVCQAGATMFDLSPAATDGKYPGKQAALMVHMVFKAAKALAPSVVFIDEVEKVFITDKARAKQFGGKELFSRIKKQLITETGDLEPEDGVLVVCNSSHPEWCVKKDERAFCNFFQQLVELPLPDYGSRQVLLRSFGEQEGLNLASKADLGLVAQLTDGRTAGQLRRIVKALTKRLKKAQQAALHAPTPGAGCGGDRSSSWGSTAAIGTAADEDTAAEGTTAGAAAQGCGEKSRQAEGLPVVDMLLELLPDMVPIGEAELKAQRDWTAKVHVPLPPEEPPKDKDGKKKKK